MKRNREIAALVCSVLLTASGCGGDDEGATSDELDAGNRSEQSGATGADMGTGGENGDMSSTSTIVPLGDGIAGKACASGEDCGGGTCATEVGGAALLPVPAPGGYCTNECAADADCGAGGECIGAIPNILAGQCFAACSSDQECRDGYLCGAGGTVLGVSIPTTCRPKPQTDQLEDDAAGRACASDDDCGGGSCASSRISGLSRVTLPEGYCTGACLQDSQCGAGGVCSPSALQGLAGTCYQSCGNDADCSRDGYRCRDVGGGIMGCDAYPDPLPDDTAGAACSSDADCGGSQGTCVSRLPGTGASAFGQGLPAPGGYCSQNCEGDADCGAGGVCLTSAFGSGRCYAPCATDSDCRDGYGCQQRGGGAAMGDAGTPTGTLVCAPLPMQTSDGGMPTDGGPTPDAG